MKTITALIFSMLAIQVSAQKIPMELRNIRYYTGQGCNDESPVLVKVCFHTQYNNPETLDIVVNYSPTITYTNKVSDFDNDGNIFYNFCTKIGEYSDFKVFFRNNKGARSAIFEIFAAPDPKQISNLQSNDNIK